MKQVKTTVLVTAILCIIYGLFSVLPMLCKAEEGKIIKVENVGGSVSGNFAINPSELSIEKGMIVIWLNTIKDQEIHIIFEDAKRLQTGTTDPMGFVQDAKGSFSAKYMPFIATSSLRFVKSGTYRYFVKSQNGKISAAGKIIVL